MASAHEPPISAEVMPTGNAEASPDPCASGMDSPSVGSTTTATIAATTMNAGPKAGTAVMSG